MCISLFAPMPSCDHVDKSSFLYGDPFRRCDFSGIRGISVEMGCSRDTKGWYNGSPKEAGHGWPGCRTLSLLHELTLYSKAGSDLSQGSFTTWSNSPILFHWLKWWYLMIITSKAISTTKKKHLQYNHHDVLICFLFLIMLVVFVAHLHASMVKLPIFTAIVSDSNGSNQVPSQPIDT